jgi:ATP-dependent helicase HrpA
MVLQFAALGDAADLRRQLVAAAFDRACLVEPLPRTRDAFLHRAEEGRNRVTLLAQELARLVGAILAEHHSLARKLQAAKAFPEAVRDVEAQLGRLMPKDFIAATPWDRLQRFPVYLKAAGLRLDKLRADPARDRRAAAEVGPLETQWLREEARQRKAGGVDPRLEQFRWLLEELRVQLFAQELKTAAAVSTKRLGKLWQTLGR